MPMVHVVRGFMVTCALTLSAGGAVAQAHAAAQIPTPPGVPDGVRITVGAGAVSAPLYEGSARYGIWAMPIFKVEMLGSAGAMGGLLDVLKGTDFEARVFSDKPYATTGAKGHMVGIALAKLYGRPVRVGDLVLTVERGNSRRPALYRIRRYETK